MVCCTHFTETHSQKITTKMVKMHEMTLKNSSLKRSPISPDAIAKVPTSGSAWTEIPNGKMRDHQLRSNGIRVFTTRNRIPMKANITQTKDQPQKMNPRNRSIEAQFAALLGEINGDYHQIIYIVRRTFSVATPSCKIAYVPWPKGPIGNSNVNMSLLDGHYIT
jgi:hypothetical protein